MVIADARYPSAQLYACDFVSTCDLYKQQLPLFKESTVD
jgi:hypothetical protein